MRERIVQASPPARARMAGALYLLYLLLPLVFGQFIKPLFVEGNAAATAKNILEYQPLWLGVASLAFSVACGIAVTVLFYQLFKPVNKSLSLLAAVFNLAGLGFEFAIDVNVGSVFHGLFCLFVGYLIFRSNFLPQVLGPLMAFAGLEELTFLSPSLAIHLSSYIGDAAVLAELSVCLWLLLMCVNVQRWEEKAAEFASNSK